MDQRAAVRFPTDLEADCRSCNRSWTSRLTNISTTGCMITFPEAELPDGALLRLRLRGLTAIDGAIVWQHRNHAGIRFQAALHPAVMEHLGFHLPDGAGEGPSAAPQQAAAPSQRRAATGLNGLAQRPWQANPATNLVSTG